VNEVLPRLRIVLVIPTLDQSGAEKQLSLLAVGLAQAGFEVNVIALNRGGHFETPLREAGIPVHILGKRWRVDPMTHFRLQRLIDQLRPDIVHSWLFAANAHVRLLRRKGWKSVVGERCVDSWKAGWQLGLDKRLVRKTDALVGNSQSVADFYCEQAGIDPRKVHVIPNAVPLPPKVDRHSEEYLSKRREWLKRWELPEDAFVVGYIGRLAQQKRIDTLLWSTQMLVHADQRTRAVFVGDGPEGPRLQELASKYDVQNFVTFTGHQADAAEFLQYFDAFWLASEFEGQSNSLMEAMASGIPVAASDIPPNRELVVAGETGQLLPVEDCQGFALAVRHWLNHPEDAAEVGRNARNRIAEHYSLEMMVNRYIALYEQLADTGKVV